MKDSTGRHRDKLLLEHEGKTMLGHALDLLMALPCDERLAVTSLSIADIIKNYPDIKILVNPEPGAGQSSSVRIGAEHARGTHMLFLLADQPLLTAEDLTPLIGLSACNPGKIVCPQVSGSPCSPVIFPCSYKKLLLKLSGDTGGRVIRDAERENTMHYIPEHPDRFIDIDCMS